MGLDSVGAVPVNLIFRISLTVSIDDKISHWALGRIKILCHTHP